MILAAAATLLGAASQSATGFGFALIAGPALLAVLEPYEAVTVLALLGVPLSALVLADSGAGDVRWRALAPMLLAAVPGLALGLLAIELAPKPALQLSVGLAVLAAVAVQLRRRGAAAPERTRRAARGPAALAGVASGALTTSIGVSGPPLVLWLEDLGLGPAELRASLAAAFLVLNPVGAAVLLAGGGAEAAPGAAALGGLTAAVVAGHLAGALAFRRIGAELFRRVILALVTAAGLASAAAGAAGLAS